MASNSIFAAKMSESNSAGAGFSKVKRNREYLISKNTATKLNSYRNWDTFALYDNIYSPEYDKVGDEWVEKTDGKVCLGEGKRSLFNKAVAVYADDSNGQYSQLRMSANSPLLDSPEKRDIIRNQSKCTVRDLVEASQKGLLGRETYDYSDFMYCKNLGKVSNNYLITLRRFPLPVDDYITTMGYDEGTRTNKAVQSRNATSVGCLVTWLGTPGNDMSSILKYDVSMPFVLKQAKWEDNKTSAESQGAGPLNAIAAVFDSKYREQYTAGAAGGMLSKYFEGMGIVQGNAPYNVSDFNGHHDNTKVYGPVDAIKETYMRSEEGIKFEQSFTLTFDYELRSYNGINGRQAMLDLIANILSVTYTTGTFWGGGYTASGAHQNNIFANLEIFKCYGGYTDFVDAFSKDVQTLGKNALGAIKTSGGFLAMAKSALNALGGMLIGGVLNALGRPAKALNNTLLSPSPVGFWHVTIGNPFHPIMSMGNMILKKATIEHYGPLGLDDFPTGLRVTCELDRGKSRDSRDIERLYMFGQERIYHPMNEKVFDMYKYCKEYKSDDTGQYKTGKYDTKGDNNADITKAATALVNAGAITSISELNDRKNILMKYFGTSDPYSIYVAATEQEYGAGKKPKSTGSGETGREKK